MKKGCRLFWGLCSMFLVVIVLPMGAWAFRLIQQTGGAGTYTSGPAVAPNANPSDDPNNPSLVTVRWRVREVPWVVNVNGAGDGLTYAQTVNAVRGALAAWQNVTPADLDLRLDAGWEDLGGILTSAPDCVSWGSNRIDCFVRGQNRHLWHKWWNGSSWSGWEDLGGILSSAATAASWAANRLDVFVRGQNRHLWHKWWNGSQWSGPNNMTRNATDGFNTIYWAEAGAPEFGGLAPILGPGTFAVTIITINANQVLQDVDIAFNGRDWVWTVAGAATANDVQAVATHEVGHGIGFHHSNVAGVTMTAGYGGGTGPRTLQADDQAATNWRYPRTWSAWEDLGGILTTAPTAASWDFNRLDIFVRGQNNHMWHKWWSPGWSAWEDLGGVITTEPDCVSWGYNRIDCFARGQNNAMWHKWWSPGWSGWENLGGVITTGPSAASWDFNRLDTFARGQNNAMWHKWWNGSSWSGWQDLGGVITSAADCVSWDHNRIDCFARGQDNAVWHKWWNGSAWSGWESLGGSIKGDPSAVSWDFGRIDVFARGQNDHLWMMVWDANSWSGWVDLGGVTTSAPDCASWGNRRVDCFARGQNQHLWHIWWTGQ